MKILKKHYFNPFHHFCGWSELSHETRLLFLTQINSNLKISSSVFLPAQISELIEAGFCLADKAALAPDVRPFRNLVRSMHRHSHFASSKKELEVDYITDHLTNPESGGIFNPHGHYFRRQPAKTAAETAVDSSWLNEFRNADSPEYWERRHANSQGTYLDKTSAALLKTWIERLIAGKNPIPFSDLPGDADPSDPSVQMALRAGVRYLLLFPALDPETLDPIIGIWPAIHARLNRKKVAPPAPVDLPEGCETYQLPILLHDMTTLLVGTAGEGLRLKAHGDLYKKEADAMESRLISMPPPGCGYQPPYHSRLYEARRWLLGMKLVASEGRRGKTLALKATPTGRQWLAASEADRLKAVLDFMRKAHRRNVEGKWREYYELAFVPNNPQHHAEEGGINLEEEVIEAFLYCLEGQWFRIKEFLAWQAESENPLLGTDQGIERFLDRWRNSDTERELLWKKVLQDFFQHRLIPLGAIKSGFDAAGNHWFSLTPAGAYLLGFANELEYETEAVAGDIVVQPNFEIVFTAANPFAEGELTRYAERLGHGVGTLFRITRTSVLLALNSGMESGQIIESLQPLASKKLPANVVAQINDWGKSFRRVGIENISIIRCPDADTALHVHALFPKKTTPLTETILQIDNPGNLAPIKRKLRENGIGIE